jgi:single-strand DNA-binding protein
LFSSFLLIVGTNDDRRGVINMDTLVVMNGYLGGDVEWREGPGFTYAWFSLGCTPRFKVAGEWRDGETTWMTVHCSRALADNVRFSLRKGDPVIVVGRLTTRTFERSDGTGRGSALQVEASGVGHDLNTGCSTYRKSVRSTPKPAQAADPTESNDGTKSADTASDDTPGATDTGSEAGAPIGDAELEEASDE